MHLILHVQALLDLISKAIEALSSLVKHLYSPAPRLLATIA